ncbi:hypothetical protein RI129_004750 [Pyrocoelia pectoralis]|uniref:Eukaryotic translation initiation factor 2D n=1 Tax=Pyrocoelia pectoralis TaxID=417401 RepID=A0AAN7VIS7_9COLE
MFSKPFQILHINRLRELEKKWLKDQLTVLYPSITDYRFTNEFLSKGDYVELIKIKTCNAVYVDVYVINRQPMMFVYGQMFPTVYFLWEYPECLLPFTTNISVTRKLSAGALLMLQGVVYPKFTASHFSVPVFERNTPVYINQTTNKAAVAVGVTLESSLTLCKRKHRGRCVYIYHYLNDELCTINNAKPLPLPELGYPEWMKESMKSISTLDITKGQTKIETELPRGEKCVGTENEIFIQNEVLEKKSMDKLLLRCFLTAIKYSKSLKLPISLTLFCDTYVKPANPTLDITKSSYGNYVHFIEKLAKEGIVVLPEADGVYNILKINYDHIIVRNFVYDPEELPKVTIINDAPLIIIENCYTVTTTVLPIFQPFGFIPGSVILASEVQGYVMEYIKCYCHQHKTVASGFVYVDNCIGFLLSKDHGSVVDVKVIKTEVIKKMTKCYKVTAGGSQVVCKGELKPIKIKIGFLCNFKKVTIVKNIEMYHIKLDDVANDCGSANDTCIKIYKMVCSKRPSQLYIYGDQVSFVYNLLRKQYGIPEECIRAPQLVNNNKP